MKTVPTCRTCAHYRPSGFSRTGAVGWCYREDRPVVTTADAGCSHHHRPPPSEVPPKRTE